tara:strand:- start:4588 stop:5379 length:792 start_codon:yes stop_codon:yes gene_type:complete
MNKIELSVILPTINEEENLKILIPNLVDLLSSKNEVDYEILVVDDGSTDNTIEFLTEFNNQNNRVKIISRTSEPSLPLSIYEGIAASKSEYVLWMDADGSMPVYDVGRLLDEQLKNKNAVIIGSRFVEGGGYKGTGTDSNKSLSKTIKNVYQSEDSLLAVFLSRIFNTFLVFLLRSEVKDITSGFIIGKKEYFNKDIFENANYGDYFIFLVLSLMRRNIELKEIGYVCLTRIAGYSKTSNSMVDLFKKGLPYIKVAIISRRKK